MPFQAVRAIWACYILPGNTAQGLGLCAVKELKVCCSYKEALFSAVYTYDGNTFLCVCLNSNEKKTPPLRPLYWKRGFIVFYVDGGEGRIWDFGIISQTCRDPKP